MNTSKHMILDTPISRMYRDGNSIEKIARAMNVGHSAIEYRLKINNVPMRSRSEALVGKPKSIEHRMATSRVRIERGLAKGERNPNWKGGISSETEKRIAAIKRNPKYKAWRKAVVSVGYCKSCGSKTGLQAHHVLPKSKFPNLIHDIDNGVCLCRSCHVRLHSKGTNLKVRELRGTPTVNTGTIRSRVKTRR